jgi:hypothetical protein
LLPCCPLLSNYSWNNVEINSMQCQPRLISRRRGRPPNTVFHRTRWWKPVHTYLFHSFHFNHANNCRTGGGDAVLSRRPNCSKSAIKIDSPMKHGKLRNTVPFESILPRHGFLCFRKLKLDKLRKDEIWGSEGHGTNRLIKIRKYVPSRLIVFHIQANFPKAHFGKRC